MRLRQSLRETRLAFGLQSFTAAMAILLSMDATSPAEDNVSSLARAVEQLDPRVLNSGDAVPDNSEADPRRMLSAHIRARRRAVNAKDVAAWRAVSTREQWESLRDERIGALKRSLGQFPEPPEDLKRRVTRTIDGDGYQINCIVFESRPGLLVTANLYRPVDIRESMPGILICHSHHNPKTQGELQDMGMTWARQGCVVLIMDQLGHGERRQHPFRSASDYDGEFRVSRQDYYFRYNVGIQLHLIGDGLIGWMAWDLMRGVDLLLGQDGVDPERIILLGAVAGGGDPVAVTAAIDERIKAVAPFNFGGPQPENVFPLPKDAELSFNYVGGGSWESTRNLRTSARDGFLPWIIVGSVAPRRLIYAHEFAWDRDKDPVWKRFGSIFDLYGKSDHLTSTHGYGRVTLSSKEASHCNNIGAHHRKQIHPALAKWFGIPVPDPEYSNRLDASNLWCVDGVETDESIELPRVHQLADRIARQRIADCRKQLAAIPRERRCSVLARRWSKLLGVGLVPPVRGLEPAATLEQGIATVRFTLGPERGIHVPVLLLLPKKVPTDGCAAVVAVAQSGKTGFLKHRSDDIATLLDAGVAVCLPDLRGTGETRPGDYRGRRSDATGLSSNELMLGGTLLGGRLNDLLSVISWLRNKSRIDPDRVAVWGDSFAPVNAADRHVDVPLRIDNEPDHSEPLGATLALLAGVFDERVAAVWARNGLVSIRSILDSQFVYVPHDFIVPGALTAGDLSDLAAAIHQSKRPIRVEGLVDGTNRRVKSELIDQDWAIARPGDVNGLQPLAEPDKDFARQLGETVRD